MKKNHEKIFCLLLFINILLSVSFSSGNDFTCSFREPIFNRVTWLVGLFQQICWEKITMYFDSLPFKTQLLKPYGRPEWVSTSPRACLMTALHRNSPPRVWGRSQDGRGKWTHFFLFWGLKPNCRGIRGCVSAAFGAEREVKWGRVCFFLELGHSTCKTDRWSHLHRGTALEYYAVFVSTFCIEKSTVKGKVKFHVKASSGVFIEFLGSHTLFTSTPCLLVWFVMGGTAGRPFCFLLPLSTAAST